MNTLKEIFLNRYALSPASYELLLSIMTERQRKKGEVLVRVGEVHQSVYFIESGAIRSYYINNDGKEVTLWFGFEGDVAVSLANIIHLEPSVENIELLEDAVILELNRSKLLELYATNIELANFGRKLAEQALLEMEDQILSIQFTDAKTRYLSLINKFPHILQRVKLGHISSYLGITQVTLSRIRAEK